MSNKVVAQLNQLQADAWVLVAKFHNYHWNVKGSQFYSIHSYTEEAYDSLFGLFDDVAERAIQIGGKAIVCPSKLVELAKAPVVEKDSFECKEVLELVRKDYEYLLKEFKVLRKVAEEADDCGTQAFAEENIAKYEKAIWMLNQTLA